MPKATKAKSKPKPSPQHFEARLERLRSRLSWVVTYVPFDAASVWGLRGQIKVKGTINGFAFRTSLFPTQEGRHFLLINKRMQKGGRAFEGNTARFQMELDVEERIVTIPSELGRILGSVSALRRWCDELNYSTRNDIGKWITEPRVGRGAGSPCGAYWRSACSTSWIRKGNCRLFCKLLSRAIHAPVKVGMPCRPLAGAGICLASSITELRTRRAAASRKCWRTRACAPRKLAARKNER